MREGKEAEGGAAGRVRSWRPRVTGPFGRGRSWLPAPRGQVGDLPRVGALRSLGPAALVRRVPPRPGRPALLVALPPLPAPFAFTLRAPRASFPSQG